MLDNAFKIRLLIQKTGLSNLDERFSVFDSKEDVFESNFIVFEKRRGLMSMRFNKSIAFNWRDQNINDFLSTELELIEDTGVHFPLQISKRIVNDYDDFLSLLKESIRLFFDYI